MTDPRKVSRVLMLLAAFVFFSVNTVYFVEAPPTELQAAEDKSCHFDFSKVRAKTPHLNLRSALLVNYSNGEVLYAKDPDSPRPIASITKLVTAMVVLDDGVKLDTTETITRDDARQSSRSRLRVGTRLTVRDLLCAALMNSDNRAARALARVTSGTIEEFVRAMNLKARQLGLKKTEFFDPTGLDERNVSTAHEVAKLLHYAYDYPLIAQITSTARHRCRALNRKNAWIQIANTNQLIRSKYKVLTGKTGYIRESDYCLTTLVQNAKGERLTCVVLGVPGDRLRFREARRLVEWGFRQV